MGGRSQTIGYRYFMSLLSGLCRGPINELVEIEAGDEKAWGVGATDSTPQRINAPNLFGGEKKEGGINGPFQVFMGEPDQVLPTVRGPSIPRVTKGLPPVKESIGTGRVSELRGVVTVWFDGLVSAMNPYLKEWAFRVRRYSKGWFNDDCWYPEKALIILAEGQVYAMNGAHILYEAITNPQWGRGEKVSRLDENSFIYGANTLCKESFGLCLAWYRKEEIDVFIQKVVDLIGGTIYTDRETGLITFRLIRNDYVVADLPLFTPETGLLDIREDDTGSADSGYNEVIGTGRDPITNQDFQVRAQNLAAFQSQKAVSSLDQDYRGIPTKELLSRVVLRDLRANADGLKRYTVVLDRRAWRIAPGMPFRIADPRRGLANVVLRAGEIDDGNMIDGKIVIKAVQDVFGLPETSYVEPSEPGWTPPSKVALPAAESRLVEASYRDVYLALGPTDAEAVPADAGYIGTLALAPNTTTYQYDLATKATGEEYEVRVLGSFTGNAAISEAVGPLDTVIPYANPSSFDEENIGQALLLGDEIVRLDALDEDTLTATVARGTADTIPQAHLAGARLWTLDDDLISDQRAYDSGEAAFAKVLTRTSTDALALDAAPELSVDVTARQGRPYPPAAVTVDGDSIYGLVGEHVEPVLAWVERNRLTQGDHLVGHGEAGVVAEAGTTYTIRVFDPDDNLLRTEAGIAALTWTYDTAMQGDDGGPSFVNIELASVRDGIESYQHYRFRVVLKSGWGYGWGLNWGGLA